MAENLFPRIASCTNAFEAWRALKDAYQGNTQVKKVRLQTFKREFENIRMQEYEAVGDYCVRVKAIIDQMETLGEEVKPEVVVKKVLRTLLHKWDHIAIIIEESKDLSTLSFDALIGSLTSHEERFQDPPTFRGEDKAFSTQGRGQGRGQKHGRGGRSRGGGQSQGGRSQEPGRGTGGNQGGNRGGQSSRGRGSDKSNKECHYCHKLGHFAREC